MINQKKILKLTEKIKQRIISSRLNHSFFRKPFEHIVIDNILDNNLAKKCEKSFPKLSKKNWNYTHNKDIEIKYRSKWNSEFDIPENIIDVVRIMNSSLILNAISKKIGIKKLIPDPYFTGGGLNVTKKGGLLDVHIDGNYHDATGLNRRLNLLIYFCKNWKKEYGGELCFYDKRGKKLIKKIEPIFNRMVIFNTHDQSYHGLPNEVNFPKKSPRKSLILYYYTKEPRVSKYNIIKKPHSALWVKKNGKDTSGKVLRKFS